MNRKKFLLNTATIIPSLALFPQLINGRQSRLQTADPYKTDLVKEFVIAGHGAKDGDLAKVQSMIADYPNIIFSKYDWGNGDFEAGIEGAGHLGNKDLAEYLINAGARVTLFVLCMLGKTDLLKPILEQYPKQIFANGPHGFTMLHHAKMGGKDGEELYTYLLGKGLTETWMKIK